MAAVMNPMHVGHWQTQPEQPFHDHVTSLFSSGSFRTSVDSEATGPFQAATAHMHHQMAQYSDPYQPGLFVPVVGSMPMNPYSLQQPFQTNFSSAMPSTPLFHSVNHGQPAPRLGDPRARFPMERAMPSAVKMEVPSPTRPAYSYLDSPQHEDSKPTLPQPTQGNTIEFNTHVDTLMRAIQAKQKHEPQQTQQPSEVRPELAQELRRAPHSPPRQDAKQQTKSQKKPTRKYECPLQDCNKRFCQKTHLVIHMRSHNGEKPHVCRHPGCGQSFSQLGNLRTHERRHTGERPYNCDICGKSFAQRGNVRAHRIVHQQIKPFTCELNKCGKRFTQLGNLKHHQNRFHADTIAELTKKFASVEEVDNVTDEERKLWEYFASLYKNSNKGIKGRGKDRRISVASSTVSTSSYTATMAPSARRDSIEYSEMYAQSASSRSSRCSSLSSVGFIKADDGFDFNSTMVGGYAGSSGYDDCVFPERTL
ncbi:uncharacterized protein EI97DRAFT_145726 [Westerdykella ornata]|uniref:C2H2-type domain-containing protein n=1 Tax=Westerdykella ornata TaxID=318751 RepID=A0A6A6JCV0_WESOR|nr:uncharacterized protein EI97DRAFT_145726 [Westerdykella ornata]KAF2273828.1 hypothetical protein EI97DRAFT_145726 [Westerdykella ornata]